MSILDDAIREHLELKRAHGADESELKKLEDEAFGPPQRPDDVSPFAEAPTEFLGEVEGSPEAGIALEEPGGRRMPNIADLQEPPPAAPETPTPEPPAIEEQPAMEHEVIAEPPAPAEEAPTPEPAAEAPPEAPAPEPAPEPRADAGHSTEERHAIAEQPTQFFDVEADMEEHAPPAEPPSPSDEQLAAAEESEPRLAATPPPTPAPAPAPEPELADEAPSEEYEEDDFFSEQRLSEELDQALEAPISEEAPLPPATEEAPAGSFFDQASTPEEQPSEEHEEPISEEYEEYETGEEEHPPPPATHRAEPAEDPLEGTPDFLEDGEDDDLWFEQRPPKDFDFDD